MTSTPASANLSWHKVGADIAIESTGRFRTRDAAAGHLLAGARKVIVSAPGTGLDATLVLDVNQSVYIRRTTTSSRALRAPRTAPRRWSRCIHSYTADQALLDRQHHDPRRARSAAVNLIPTGTGAARAIGQVLPALAGKLDGVAIRVTVENGSLTDLTVELERDVPAEEINHAFAEAAAGNQMGSSATPKSRSSRATSSATPPRACSTRASPAPLRAGAMPAPATRPVRLRDSPCPGGIPTEHRRGQGSGGERPFAPSPGERGGLAWSETTRRNP